MNRVTFFLFIALCSISFTEAAGAKPKYFNLYEDLQGSWASMETTVSLITGEVVGVSVQRMYNLTKNEIPNELVISEVDLATFNERRKPFLTILSVSSNYTAQLNRFSPGADIEIEKECSIVFNEFLRNEVFYASGSLEKESMTKFEVTILPDNIMKIEIDHPELDERTVIMAKKIIIEAPRSFFQKYGSYMMIGVAIVIQLVTSNMNKNPYS